MGSPTEGTISTAGDTAWLLGAMPAQTDVAGHETVLASRQILTQKRRCPNDQAAAASPMPTLCENS